MATTADLLISVLVLLSNLSTTIASSPSPEYPPTCPQISPSPIPLQEVLSHFPPRAVIDVSATETIKRTLAIYALAVDGKDWAALDAVFAADAVANYSAPLGVLTGLSAIQSTLSVSLAQFPGGTQHSLGTQIVDVCAPDAAVSVTYYTATHYLGAARNYTSIVNNSQVLYAHGQYQDTWKKQQDGAWKIAYRNLVYMVSDFENVQSVQMKVADDLKGPLVSDVS